VVHLARLIELKRGSVKLHSLQAFDTEQQFCRMLKYRPLFIDFIMLHRVHEMQTVVTDVYDVCLSVCPFVSLSVMRLNSVWCIHAAFAKLLWLFVLHVVMV